MTAKPTPRPTGRLRGDDLVINRTFRAPIDDVWSSVTMSESTARWFGPWERAEGGDDKKIRIQMAFEEGKPWLDGTIEHCEAPHHVAVTTIGQYGAKLLSMKLSESAGVTTLEFTHHRINKKMVGEMGPGWEYYLDMLVAAREGKPRPDFHDYYPSQKEHFTSLEG